MILNEPEQLFNLTSNAYMYSLTYLKYHSGHFCLIYTFLEIKFFLCNKKIEIILVQKIHFLKAEGRQFRGGVTPTCHCPK